MMRDLLELIWEFIMLLLVAWSFLLTISGNW